MAREKAEDEQLTMIESEYLFEGFQSCETERTNSLARIERNSLSDFTSSDEASTDSDDDKKPVKGFRNFRGRDKNRI